jgi:microcystin-dependent protein
MATPFLGEVKLVSFNFAPKGWALCNGQLLPINQNQPLFALFGTIYGGNGTTNFALPNLQGRIPVGRGAQFVQGQVGGEVAHTLQLGELPQHAHPAAVNTGTGTFKSPSNNFWAAPAGQGYTMYNPTLSGGSAPMAPQTVAPVGGSQPHENMPPYLVITAVVALSGIFPSRN